MVRTSNAVAAALVLGIAAFAGASDVRAALFSEIRPAVAGSFVFGGLAPVERVRAAHQAFEDMSVPAPQAPLGASNVPQR